MPKFNLPKAEEFYNEYVQGIDVESMSPAEVLTLAKTLISAMTYINTLETLTLTWESRAVIVESLLNECLDYLSSIVNYTPAEELPPGFSVKVFQLTQTVIIKLDSGNKKSPVANNAPDDLSLRLAAMVR